MVRGLGTWKSRGDQAPGGNGEDINGTLFVGKPSGVG